MENFKGEEYTAQLFNNFVVLILEQRRKIGAAFLRRYFNEIEPSIVQELDFESYSTEPTVHIFGAQVSRLCDLVFSIPFKDRSKGAQAVVVPLEHKSTQARNVVLQLLTSLILVLQYILRHKERFQRSDKKFVWPFLLLFYTGARPWKKVLNFPDLFATPNEKLDKRWIFKLPFKFASLFTRSKKQIEDDPWLKAFLELTKAAERIVAKKEATSEDWKKAWNDAFSVLTGKINSNDKEEKLIISDFIVFVSKVAIRQGWNPPTREEITLKLEELGSDNMTYKIDSIYDLAKMSYLEEGKKEGLKIGKREGRKEGRREGRREGRQEGKKEGRQENLREMLASCITLRFPRIAQTTLDAILSIADSDVLKSIFNVACTADSLDNFQRDVRALTPTI